MNLQAGLVRREEMLELQRVLSDHVNQVRVQEATVELPCERLRLRSAFLRVQNDALKKKIIELEEDVKDHIDWQEVRRMVQLLCCQHVLPSTTAGRAAVSERCNCSTPVSASVTSRCSNCCFCMQELTQNAIEAEKDFNVKQRLWTEENSSLQKRNRALAAERDRKDKEVSDAKDQLCALPTVRHHLYFVLPILLLRCPALSYSLLNTTLRSNGVPAVIQPPWMGSMSTRWDDNHHRRKRVNSYLHAFSQLATGAGLL